MIVFIACFIPPKTLSQNFWLISFLTLVLTVEYRKFFNFIFNICIEEIVTRQQLIVSSFHTWMKFNWKRNIYLCYAYWKVCSQILRWFVKVREGTSFLISIFKILKVLYGFCFLMFRWQAGWSQEAKVLI